MLYTHSKRQLKASWLKSLLLLLGIYILPNITQISISWVIANQ